MWVGNILKTLEKTFLSNVKCWEFPLNFWRENDKKIGAFPASRVVWSWNWQRTKCRYIEPTQTLQATQNCHSLALLHAINILLSHQNWFKVTPIDGLNPPQANASSLSGTLAPRRISQVERLAGNISMCVLCFAMLLSLLHLALHFLKPKCNVESKKSRAACGLPLVFKNAVNSTSLPTCWRDILRTKGSKNSTTSSKSNPNESKLTWLSINESFPFGFWINLCKQTILSFFFHKTSPPGSQFRWTVPGTVAEEHDAHINSTNLAPFAQRHPWVNYAGTTAGRKTSWV